MSREWSVGDEMDGDWAVSPTSSTSHFHFEPDSAPVRRQEQGDLSPVSEFSLDGAGGTRDRASLRPDQGTPWGIYSTFEGVSDSTPVASPGLWQADASVPVRPAMSPHAQSSRTQQELVIYPYSNPYRVSLTLSPRQRHARAQLSLDTN